MSNNFHLECQLYVVMSNVALPDSSEHPIDRFIKLLKSHNVVYNDKPPIARDFDENLTTGVVVYAHATIVKRPPRYLFDGKPPTSHYRWKLTCPLIDLLEKVRAKWSAKMTANIVWNGHNGSSFGDVSLQVETSDVKYSWILSTPAHGYDIAPLWPLLMRGDDFDLSHMPFDVVDHIFSELYQYDEATIISIIENPSFNPTLYSGDDSLFGRIHFTSVEAMTSLLRLPAANPNRRGFNDDDEYNKRMVHAVAQSLPYCTRMIALLLDDPRTDISALRVYDSDVNREAQSVELLLDNKTFDIHNLDCRKKPVYRMARFWAEMLASDSSDDDW